MPKKRMTCVRIESVILSQTEYRFLFMKFQVIKELVITDNKSRHLSLDHDHVSSHMIKHFLNYIKFKSQFSFTNYEFI